MNFGTLNELPEWDDLGKEGDEGDEWKPNLTAEACKALYTKWNEVMVMVNGALSLPNDVPNQQEDYLTSRKAMIIGDGYEAGAKIHRSEAGGIYVLRMENAAIIRKNAQYIKSAILGLMIEGEVDEEHGEIIRNGIDEFRELYKHWISTFEKDEFVDEWGLFV